MSDQSYSALTDAIVRAIAANNFRVPTDLAGIKVDATLSGSTVANTAGVASKGVVQTIRSTIVNAQSVAAGGNGGVVSLGLDGTESEVYVSVNTDQQPWGATASQQHGNFGASVLFPERWNHATAYPNLTLPHLQMYLAEPINPFGLGSATTTIELKSRIFPYLNTSSIIFHNQSANIATVTIRVIRVWR